MPSYHTVCPKCRNKGKDTSGDNLAVYSDNHKFCFSCGYREPADIGKLMSHIDDTSPIEIKGSNLPDDISYIIPKEPYRWLKQYGIMEWEIKQHRFCWSEIRQLLIFPVFGDNSKDVVFWQGRYFGNQYTEPVIIGGRTMGYEKSRKPHPKYLTSGQHSGILHVLGEEHKNTIILTEDLISAIKVSRVYSAMPLWGSNLASETMKRLHKYCISHSFAKVGIWLDPDKNIEAVKMAMRMSQLFPEVAVIQSALDPKDYGTDAIVQLVQGDIDDIINKLDEPILTDVVDEKVL